MLSILWIVMACLCNLALVLAMVPGVAAAVLRRSANQSGSDVYMHVPAV